MRAYLNRNFVLTFAATFVSIFGAKLLMMAYLAFVFESMGSATLAAGVLVAERASCMLVGLFGARYIDRMNAKGLLIKLNVLAALATLAFALVTKPEQYRVALAVILVRALLSHAIISTSVKGLVQFFSKEETAVLVPVFNASRFTATAAAGGAGIYLLEFVDVTTVVYAASTAFVFAAGLIAFVRPDPQRLAESVLSGNAAATGLAYLKSAAKTIAANSRLASAVFYLTLAVTTFQATYEVLMTIVPQIWFGLGKSGTALFFTFEAVFVTAGAFLYQFLSRRGLITSGNQRLLNLVTIVFAATVYVMLPWFKGSLVLCLTVFNVMVLAFELVWTHQFRQIILHAPPSQVVGISGLQRSVAFSLMGVTAFLFSCGVDALGIATTVYLNAVLLILLTLGWDFLTRPPVCATATDLITGRKGTL